MAAAAGLEAATTSESERLLHLLADLPPESIVLLEQFAEYLREQSRLGAPVGVAAGHESHPCHYPNVALPASALKELAGIMPPVGGDALADTEALYDEA